MAITEENCPLTPWRGEPLAGKTILLYGELGYGDEILSWRFAKPLKDMGARVIISVRPPLFRLAHGLAFVDAVIRQYGPAPYEYVEMLEYDVPPWQPDYCCALLAVPMFATAGLICAWSSELDVPPGPEVPLPVGMDPDTLPCRSGYLRAPCDGRQMPDGLNVGICWAAGKSHQQFAERKSLPVRRLASLARPGVNLVSLQLQHGEDLRGLGIIDAMTDVTDFADTAGIIDRLDLVITVDTAIAHLAGALGKPVWNLVRLDATSLWPWMWETDATPWYNSMTLYRQLREGDWDEPLSRMFADFDRFYAAACPSFKHASGPHTFQARASSESSNLAIASGGDPPT